MTRRPIGITRPALTSSALALAFAALLSPAQAGCMVRPQPYKLQSDTVHWSFTIAAGSQCIQGVRSNAVILENLEVVDQPKNGRIALVGPGFRYSATTEPGTDSFELSVTGTAVRLRGNSHIIVDVAVQ